MANTVIQIKRSSSTATPTNGSLAAAEPAYSFQSNKLFIGNTAGTGVVTVGGKYYVDEIDSATSSNTVSTLVKRDANGSFSASNVFAELVGNALTATTLKTARTISFSGDVDAVSNTFDGSGNVSFNLELTNTGVTAGTYGGATNIPVLAIDVDGRVTSASNVAVATTLNITGDTGSDGVSLINETLNFEGGDGITSIVSNNKVSFAVDNTVLRTTGGGSQTISGDLAVSGNLIVSGETVTQDVTTIRTEDSLILLAANNAADALDIGFYGQYVSAGNTLYSGLVRDASDSGIFKLFAGETTDPTSNVVTYDSSNRATLDANITGGTVSGLSADIAVADGGTGASSFTAGVILIGNGTSALQSLANTGSAGTYANASHVPVITTDAYGRVSGVTNTQIAIAASQVTSGTLPIARGGTNQTTFTTGSLVNFDGTSLASIANTTYTQTGTLAANSTVTSVSVDAYGRLTALTASAISIDASQISSGTLGIVRGGTGASSFTVKGVIVSDSSSTTGALSALTSSTEGHVLQISATGTPSFAGMDGGTF